MSPNGISALSSNHAEGRDEKSRDNEVGGVASQRDRAAVGEGAAASETGNSNNVKLERASGLEDEKPHNVESVARCARAPDIPNVVEYHLRVQRQTRVDSTIDEESSADEMKDRDSETYIIHRRHGVVKTEEEQKELTVRLSKLVLSTNNNVNAMTADGFCDLPQVFQVKYLGSHDARGLWGIKNIRKPVDNMVAAAKALSSRTILPFMKLVVSRDGVGLLLLGKRTPESSSSLRSKLFPIETISYGVQDLVYTRVFSMIVVRETDNFRRVSPFECHGFVCESKFHARQMTLALATAFQIYSQQVKDRGDDDRCSPKGFALEMKNSSEFQPTNLTIYREAQFC